MTLRQAPAETTRLARAVPILLVVAACLFNALAYLTELRDAAPDTNDDVFHSGLVRQMNDAWDAGGNPLDTWIADWGQGFPVLRYYQHLPHFVVVLTYRALGGTVPLHRVFDGVTWLLLALLPLTFYVGSRRLGAAPITAACIAVCVPLLGADPSQHHFLGFQARSFLWSGGGLFTQLAAIVLFPLAVGTISQAALQGRRYAPAIAWLGATWLCHLVLGYMACLLSVVVLLRPEARGQARRVALRLAATFAGVAIVSAYLLLPTLLEGQWLSRSMWEAPEYWDSYGASRVLAALATGGLLDGQRIPVLTILAGLGALLAGRSWLGRSGGTEQGFFIAALCMFVLGLLLFFGRPTWGALVGVLPFSGSLPMHRFICAVQFGGLLLAGIALARLAQRFAWSRQTGHAALAVATVLIVLGPAIARTVGVAQQNATWRREAAAADVAAGPLLGQAFRDFAAVDATLPGRGYAGTSWDWGSKFKVGGTQVYHRWSGYGLPAISYMYHTMGLCSDLEPAFNPARRDHLELFNVRNLLADDARRLPWIGSWRPLAPGLVSSVVETEGYFGVVGSAAFVRYAKGEAGALREFNRAFIASRWHAERRFVRIGWRPGDAPSAGEQPLTTAWSFKDAAPSGWQAPRGRVLSSSGRGDRYRARVRLEDPGMILFRMCYHPNWQASLDGRPVPTVMLSPGYLGIRAPAGEHAVEMIYRSPAWTRALPWVGLAFLVLVAIADARRGADRRR
jgi:hypothetical protein